MSFHQFLSLVDGGDESYYLSTQSLEEDDVGLPTQLFGAPLTELV
jgi:hypothetical protein